MYSPNETPPRDHLRDPRDNMPINPTHSPQVVSAAATLANMDMGTRFPFNQQSFKQTEEHRSEQVVNSNKTDTQNDTGFQGKNGMLLYIFRKVISRQNRSVTKFGENIKACI